MLAPVAAKEGAPVALNRAWVSVSRANDLAIISTVRNGIIAADRINTNHGKWKQSARHLPGEPDTITYEEATRQSRIRHHYPINYPFSGVLAGQHRRACIEQPYIHLIKEPL